MTDFTSGHYDLLYKAEDIPEHVEADALDATPAVDSCAELRQLSVMNMVSADRFDGRIGLPLAVGHIDINTQLLFPDGRFEEPRINIGPIKILETIPGGTRTFTDASTPMDDFWGDGHVYAGNNMPLGIPPYEAAAHPSHDTRIMHEPNPDSESIELSLSSMDLYNNISTCPPRDDEVLRTRPMRE